jgi:hypothetical protein
MSNNTQKQDHADITKAPLPIQKLYQVAMESKEEVLERLCIEQYIEEAM